MSFPVCPSCNGFIPNNDTPGAYPGALSRKDNKTEICSSCGVKEALGPIYPCSNCNDGSACFRLKPKLTDDEVSIIMIEADVFKTKDLRRLFSKLREYAGLCLCRKCLLTLAWGNDWGFSWLKV